MQKMKSNKLLKTHKGSHGVSMYLPIIYTQNQTREGESLKVNVLPKLRYASRERSRLSTRKYKKEGIIGASARLYPVKDSDSAQQESTMLIKNGVDNPYNLMPINSQSKFNQSQTSFMKSYSTRDYSIEKQKDSNRNIKTVVN